MPSRRSTQLVTMFALSLAATIGCLVAWVVYMVRSFLRQQALNTRAGLPPERFNWIVLSVGCVLLFFLIVGLVYQLAQALAAQRHAVKQEEFMSNVTHEMKSPLAAIKLHAQTLQQQEGMTPEARRKSLGFIVEQADRMGTLVDNVLESSRLLSRKRELVLRPVGLAPFFEEYLQKARPLAESRGVSLRADVTTTSTVLATEEALRRVMDNLIGNAVRVSPRGGEVRCRVADGLRAVRLEVEDDGTGIPQRELPFIFDRFYQPPEETGANRHGTGLGLSIVSGLVGEMQGTVQVFSEEGKGSRFVIELPVPPPEMDL